MAKALLAEQCASRGRALPASAYHNDRTLTIFLQFAETIIEFTQWNELAAHNMSGVVFTLLTHVQHQCLLVVDELRCCNVIDFLDPADTVAEERPEQHRAAGQRNQDRPDVILQELLHVCTPRIFGWRILTERKSARGRRELVPQARCAHWHN